MIFTFNSLSWLLTDPLSATMPCTVPYISNMAKWINKMSMLWLKNTILSNNEPYYLISSLILYYTSEPTLSVYQRDIYSTQTFQCV